MKQQSRPQTKYCAVGMKAYIDDQDRIRMFRPEMNLQRLNSSCESLFFPTFEGEEFLQCLQELLRVERDWIPREYGYSLYLRPTIISTFPYIGLNAAENVKLYVICSPVGPYYPEGFKPISLLASDKDVRAWPGGVGNKKLGTIHLELLLFPKTDDLCLLEREFTL